MISAALLSSLAVLQPVKFGRDSGTLRSAVGSTVGVSRRDLVGVLVSGAGAIASVALIPEPVWAESSLATRQQAYTRYVPRIERGRDYWQNGLKKLIASQNWAEISKALEKKGSIDRLFGPMELWASSWSGKSISEKTLAMNVAIDELREACRGLRVASEGKETVKGFLGFESTKVMDPSKRQQLAQAAYAKGVQAINQYIEIGNDGIGLQVCNFLANNLQPHQHLSVFIFVPLPCRSLLLLTLSIKQTMPARNFQHVDSAFLTHSSTTYAVEVRKFALPHCKRG